MTKMIFKMGRGNSLFRKQLFSWNEVSCWGKTRSSAKMLGFKMWWQWMLFLHYAFLVYGLMATLSTGHIQLSTPLDFSAYHSKDVTRTRSSTTEPSKTSSQDNCNPRFSVLKPMDCAELSQMGHQQSGVYTIWLRNKIIDGRKLDVYCDMETDKGGWTILQRRGNFLRPNNYFYKDWRSYKLGFGDIERDFWLGNDNIFALTNQRLYSVRFDLVDVEGVHLYALYDTFFIENEESKYKLTIQDYSGTANDSMIIWHNGQLFSTKDQDNDNNDKSHCAQAYKGAWWYNSCHASNLNGLYLLGKHQSFADGIEWSKWKGQHESLESTEIKIRPKDFRRSTV